MEILGALYVFFFKVWNVDKFGIYRINVCIKPYFRKFHLSPNPTKNHILKIAKKDKFCLNMP